MKNSLISRILNGTLSAEELDDAAIGGEPNAAVDDSKIATAGTDSTANGTETTPETVPATNPDPDGDANGESAANTDEASAATDETAAAETAGEGDATEPAAAADPSLASVGDEAGASGPAAGDDATASADPDAQTEAEPAPQATDVTATAGEGTEGADGGEGEPEKKEPSPDAEVTPLPETDPEEEANVDPDAEEDPEVEAEIDETEEDIAAKADAVADLSNAQTALEELAEAIEETVQDGGLTPEGVIAAQGAANDILGDIGEEPIGLPSQESFGSFEGRRANTTIALEGIGEKVKAVGAKAMEALRYVLAQLRKLFNVQRHMLSIIARKAEAKMKEEHIHFKAVTINVAGEVSEGLCLPQTTLSANASFISKQGQDFLKAKTRLDGMLVTIEQATAGGKFDVSILERNKDIDLTINASLKRMFEDAMSNVDFAPVAHDCAVVINSLNDLRAVYNVVKNVASASVDFIDKGDRRLVNVDRSLEKLYKGTTEAGEREAIQHAASSLSVVSRVVRSTGRYAKTLMAVANRIEQEATAA